MNKKIITLVTLLTLIQTHSNLCMEKTTTNTEDSWDIFAYLNWHNSPFQHTFNACDEVEKLINQDPSIVNKKKIYILSRFYDKTPLEVAVTESKCNRCAQLLRQKGAKDTEYITYWEKKYSNK